MWKKKHEQEGLDKLPESDREMLAQMKAKEKKVELVSFKDRKTEMGPSFSLNHT